MIKIGLREARSHFSRFVMSMIAIALGVGFVVGSFCFREMLNNQVDQMMASNMDADVYVRGDTAKSDGTSSASGTSSSSTTTYNDIAITLQNEVATVSGVKTAKVPYSVSGLVLVGKDGNAVATVGAPTTGIGMSASDPWRSATLAEGSYASGENEIALDSYAAQKADLHVGDSTTLVYPEGPRTVKVSGIFHTANSQAGALIIGLDPAVAKAASDKLAEDPNQAQYIAVYGSANDGKALDDQQQSQLADAINATLPSSSKASAVTGDTVRDEQSKSIKDSLGFIQPLILIFAIIALFVGSFIIANTFSMIVRESMRGYALLRSVGASPAQVFMTVIIQAIVMGVVGSVAGIGLGWGMVKLIAAGMSQIGSPLTGASNPTASDIVIGLLVGVCVSLVGAALPARHASIAPPLQAMNETVNPEKPTRLRAILGGVMCVLGIISWVFTIQLTNAKDGLTPWKAVNDMNAGWPLGVGAAFIVIGFIVLSPALVTMVSRVLGWPPSLVFPVTGKLATRNLSRSKRRTANTAAALFVGIAIVSCLSVVASSAKSSVSGIVDNGLKSEFVAMASGGMGTIPDAGVDAVKDVKGVKSVTANKLLQGVKFDGKSVQASTVTTDSSLFTDVFTPQDPVGDPDQALKDNELVVAKNIADDKSWSIGDTLTVSTELSTVKLKVGAITNDATFSSSIIIGHESADKLVAPQMQMTTAMYISTEKGADLTTVKKALVDAVKPYYIISIMNQDEFKSTISSMVDQIMLILYALLALSIVIAIFGIVNTLALSVSERTREIGLLRAIGTSKAQVRGMLAIESSMISVFGTIIGMFVGCVAGAVIQQVYASQGLEKLDMPWLELLVFLVMAIVIGVLASLPPARRALKVPVLDAVSTD
ncbi:ABC transporter permease [Bifidobacterium crudilactis]|uniref:ABC transporter permease n=1 Tax=Bifidobacterium crudilactis TaxID=327277 RepID=UPI0023556D92|nr:FtsX-like permease family protein [Bifidobacterium crudilactis]MCI2157980.1 FtsX-like permease family protein [Bifidobacterium crudilactis]